MLWAVRKLRAVVLEWLAWDHPEGLSATRWNGKSDEDILGQGTLRGGNEPSLGRHERGRWLGWGRDLCRVSWEGTREDPDLLQIVNIRI